ncbi:type I restriction-modification system subunit M [Ruegeria profundi]|uniref:site-specific DNA-methyltransferase (adenine-specific) n=1 Tax=Ruegeria profundi TaxID=1685378 RepID=A0A0X3TPQ9_9RHOB|nr:class I SAM-dependent DNA methyltransferase [Ruegeria profundi]KUJ77742.1 type I restriction endonuclease subunit M [Ruegeria profundi]
MAVKKTDLYASLWASCDELRGGMDASQYKNYILTLLFMKYVSDKYANQKYGAIVVPEGGSFGDMVAADGKTDIGDRLNTIVGAFAKANDMDWLRSADNDFNNEDRLGKGKAMVDTLSKLVRIFDGLDLGRNQAEGDDLMGDAYEYLMRHFATESGKSKGQFYTPSEVSIILSKVIGIDSETKQDQTAYDPTCGSGSLLLKVNAEAPNGLSLFGQEKEQATAALAKMNMVLHNSPTGVIWQDDTISAPHWTKADGTLETFDYAVANPPFSLKSWSNGIVVGEDQFSRFEYGEPPEKNGDYAFLLHVIKSLKSTGKGAVILPHGVLFRGNVEADIRRNLIHQGYIKGIIGLPANLFYGTGIPACIVVIDKAAAKANNPIFMIDASKGFIKDGNKNRLRSQDIHRIVDTFNNQIEVDRYSRLVPYDEIADKNEFNLNIPRYIDASEPEDIHDLSAHLQGGIPNADIDALSRYWDVFPNLRSVLFEDGVRPNYSKALVEPRQIKKTILDQPEFETFKSATMERFEAWKTRHVDRLKKITNGDHPKELIHTISEDLLGSFADADLLDKYDIYQILMSYWRDVMQDDVYMLVQDGWEAASKVRQLVPVKDKNGKNVYKEEADFEFGAGKAKTKHKSDLIPPALVVDRYFADEKADLEAKTQARDEAAQALESYIDENSGEDSLIQSAHGDNGKYAQAEVKRQIKAVTDPEEVNALKKLLKLQTAETTTKKAEKDAIAALNLKVFQKIPQLSEQEAKTLVVDDKWVASVESQVEEEVERVTQALANRVRVLEERYAKTLPKLEEAVGQYSAKVEAHLKKMGLSW